MAGHLLARARTPEDLGRLQARLDARAPAVLGFIARTKIDNLTADQVLELGVEAVDSFHADR